VALPCLGLAAALGLELIARAERLQRGARWGVSLAALGLAFGLFLSVAGAIIWLLWVIGLWQKLGTITVPRV